MAEKHNKKTDYGLVLLLALLLPGACNAQQPPVEIPTDMVRVAGETFSRGTDESEFDNIMSVTSLQYRNMLQPEVPRHDITVDDFFIDKWAVTNAQFAEFIRSDTKWSPANVDSATHNGRYLENWVNGIPPTSLQDHPVVFVTWRSAVAYCEWQEKRLPTEAEFEWAAQGAGDGARFPWGNSPPSDDVVNWGGNDIDSTVPVGSYPPNGRGLYDMSGNVWEFTADPWLGSYQQAMEMTAVERAAASAEPDIRRVVRGGSWGANAANLRIRYRDSHRPFDAREMVGFRCAKSIE